MRKTLLLLLVLCALPAYALAQTLGVEGDQIMIGDVDTVYSETLGEERPIWVYVPRGARSAEKKFPVLYLLDGSAHFYSVVGMIRQLSVANGNTILPEMVVVAIPNTNRVRDLTPNAIRQFPGSGGAEDFSTFLEKELIPFVDQKYPVTAYRSLVGHSWGGLFVLNTLIHHTDLFENYLAIDPSIRWNNLSFFHEAVEVLDKHEFKSKSLFLASANRLPKGLDLQTVRTDTSRSSEHMRTMLQLTDVAGKAKGLAFDWKFYPDDNHNGVPLIAGYDGLRSLFKWYYFNEEMIFKEGRQMNAKELLDLIVSHFQGIADHFDYPFLPPEALIDRFGDITMYGNEPVKALAFYALNIHNYPDSYRVYESMGDFYRYRKDHEKAIELYEQSLSVEANARVQRKLDGLKK